MMFSRSILGELYFLTDNPGPLVCNVHKQAKNLGLIFDSELIFDM